MVKSLKVVSPARLHFGFLDPSGLSGRKFASLGLVINGFDVVLQIQAATNLNLTGDNLDNETKDYLRETVERLVINYNFPKKFNITLIKKPPRHSGFGSGTQLALALGRAVGEFFNITPSTKELSLVVNRGKRSGIGILGFDKGGFIVDGGKSNDGKIPPLISRVHFPEEWKVLLVTDSKGSTFFGDIETDAINRLPKLSEGETLILCRETFLKVLPAIIEKDFNSFAEGISKIQGVMGDIFYDVQHKSRFSSPSVGKVIEHLANRFQIGSGQSSWGPTGFAIFRSIEELNEGVHFLQEKDLLEKKLTTHITSARNEGYKIIRGS